jgi:carboxylesterase
MAKRALWAVLFSILFLGSGCGIYNWMAQRALVKEMTRDPRDPATKVVVGSEAETLRGSGRNAALLVHGFVGSRVDFNDLGPSLQNQGLTVRLTRLPGHATFPFEHAVTTAEELLEAVRNEYAAMKNEYDQVALIGFSMGGALSTLVASERQVDRLVLIAPYFGVTHRWYYPMPVETLNAISAFFIPYVMKNEYFTCVNRPEAKSQLYSYKVISTQGAQELIRLGKWARDKETLAKVTCPVLMLHSWGDRAAAPKRAEKAFEAIGSADKRAVWYEESNHHLLWDWEREEVKGEILRFLAPLYGEESPSVSGSSSSSTSG